MPRLRFLREAGAVGLILYMSKKESAKRNLVVVIERIRNYPNIEIDTLMKMG